MGGILEEGVWFTFLRVNVSCLLPTALSAMLLVPECSSNFSRSSKDVLEKDAHLEPQRPSYFLFLSPLLLL